MKRIAILLVAVVGIQQAFAQNELSELSAKERFRLAEKEKIEAATDIAFQQKMSEGHELFTNKHYLKAIYSYEKAAEIRPYNV
jgi:hypothetical protein